MMRSNGERLSRPRIAAAISATMTVITVALIIQAPAGGGLQASMAVQPTAPVRTAAKNRRTGRAGRTALPSSDAWSPSTRVGAPLRMSELPGVRAAPRSHLLRF